MEARIFRAVLLAAMLVISTGASYRTSNFIVRTDSAQLAEQLGQAAEKCRRDLALAWLGHGMPDWAQPCVMTVQAGRHLGAGGATTFIFDRGEVFGWRMTIQGSVERLFDSVLPHEITHMVFASHFRRPLPRWADEGGATSVEHGSELAKHRTMLVRFLKTNRGIAFNRMFAMTEYPRDVMPLYAQGYSLAEFLIQQGGRRKFVQFLADGMKDGRWSAAIEQHYGIPDAAALQNVWLAWVRQGNPPLHPPADRPGEASPPQVLVAGGKLPRPQPNLIYHLDNPARAASSAGSLVPVETPARVSPQGADLARAVPPMSNGPSTSGWHAAGQRTGSAVVQAVAEAVAEPSGPQRLQTQTAHPQPLQQSPQIILQQRRR